MKSQCPRCKAMLRWLELWRMSSVLKWRAAAPCPRCGTPLRRSAMTYLTNVASVGLIGFVMAHFVYPDSRWIAPLVLGFAVVMFVGAVSTRLETAPHEPNAKQE